MRRVNVYRAAIWLPMTVPVAGIAAGYLFKRSADPPSIVAFVSQILASSLVYGGIPYVILAVWASARIKDRSEAEIEELMYRAPLLMAGLVFSLYLVVGAGLALARHSRSPLEAFLAVGVTGAVTAIPLGYAYVGVVMMFRRVFDRRIQA